MFCFHKYEVLSNEKTCTELVIVYSCKKCGKICTKKTKINNHEFALVQTGTIENTRTGDVLAQIKVLRCKKCGILKEWICNRF